MGNVKIALVVSVAVSLIFMALGSPELAAIATLVTFCAIWLTSLVVHFVFRRQYGRREPFFHRLTHRGSRATSYYYYGN